MNEECIYPVRPFTAWTIWYFVHDSLTPKTVEDVARQFNISRKKARRILDKEVSKGRLSKKVESFWNGMFWATRNWYW